MHPRIVAILVTALFAAGLAEQTSGAGHPRTLSRKQVRERTGALPPTLAREVSAMQYLLTPHELTDLLSNTRPERVSTWIEAWWAERDPIPTSPENEVRTEHEQRVLDAQALFGRGPWPGWDDRGEVLIRYGTPPGRAYLPAEVGPGFYVPSEESWYYPQFAMYVRFFNAGNSGYVQYLESVHLPASERARNDRRVMASEYNPDAHMDYLTLDTNAWGFYDLPPPFAIKGWDDYMKRVYRFHEVIDKAPAVHTFDYPWMHIPAFVSVHCFRGGNGVDRVDVNAEFESGVTPLPRGAGRRRFVTTSVFWDRRGEEIARYARVDSIGTGPYAADSLATVINQTTLTLPPGTYRVAVTVQEDGSRRFFSMRRVVGFDDMDTDIAMSDLVLAREIGAARETSPFNRGPVEVVPRPSGHYPLGTPVPVYFEVYHAGMDAGARRPYTVEYTIKPKTERPRSLWSRLTGSDDEPLQVGSRFDALAMGATDAVRVFANTQDLWPGEFTLEVSVTDGERLRRVTRETTFRLLP